MPKILKTEKTNVTENSYSVQIQFNDEITLWFDVWMDEDGEIDGDWNKYIFHTDNEQDMKKKAFQEAHSDEAGAYNFATAMSIASDVFQD